MFIFWKKKEQKRPINEESKHQKELEKKVIEGAQKALGEYRRVFERLAEFDKV